MVSHNFHFGDTVVVTESGDWFKIDRIDSDGSLYGYFGGGKDLNDYTYAHHTEVMLHERKAVKPKQTRKQRQAVAAVDFVRMLISRAGAESYHRNNEGILEHYGLAGKDIPGIVEEIQALDEYLLQRGINNGGTSI